MSVDQSNQVVLPPGLYLPTAEEDTSQYLTENFHPSADEYWKVVDYGAFVVSLVAFDVAEGNRVSTRPKSEDYRALRDAGYGLPITALAQRFGGPVPINRELGFHTAGDRPDRASLLKRYEWIAQNALDAPAVFGEDYDIRYVLEWCSNRDLAPPTGVVYDAFDRDIREVRAIFGKKERHITKAMTRRDMYHFGAEVIAENGGIIPHAEFNARYRDRLGYLPTSATERFFGGDNRFWLEFDRVTDTSGLTPDEVVNIGTRLLIRTGRTQLDRKFEKEQMAQQQLPSHEAIGHRLGSRANFRERVHQDMKVYQDLVSELQQAGIDPSITQLFCRRFDTTPEFRDWLIAGKEVMVKLSDDMEGSSYVRKLLGTGLDLLKPDVYDMQLADLLKHLKGLDIRTSHERRFVLEAMPRLEAAEALHKTL